MCQGGTDVGQYLVADKRVNLVSFAGSCNTVRQVGVAVQERFSKSILELGGNNALLIDESANLKMALDAALFGCIGTSGQRCTTMRRIIVHEKLYDQFVDALVVKYQQLVSRIGHELELNTLVGPVHAQQNVENFKTAIQDAIKEGGSLAFGGKGEQLKGFLFSRVIFISHLKSGFSGLQFDKLTSSSKINTFTDVVYKFFVCIV
ncbi:putative aldehyde dehydrogenase family 7 member A1 homolog [Drosophila willistoni]|uniref:putative aldehyde dehydrogenase family 7 member A1 homolog n=1 Tax=Drosophila willistoni TaxID=7260 RepID=UPI001F07D1BB|nr:putative aldehyde dehydrogenase family 7 member A1 homolog [Drosophila willistoni]